MAGGTAAIARDMLALAAVSDVVLASGAVSDVALPFKGVAPGWVAALLGQAVAGPVAEPAWAA